MVDQKNFRNFTLDELLQLGFSIHLHHHDIHSETEAKTLTSKFEGMKRSSYDLNEDLKVVRAWKDKVEISVFLNKLQGNRQHEGQWRFVGEVEGTDN